MFLWKNSFDTMLNHRFVEEIEQAINKKVKVRINDNHSTMLSVKWDPECTKVSIHRMFLEAPKNIMEALTCYIKSENQSLCPSVQAYIEEKLRTPSYSYRLPDEKLLFKGKYYNLKMLYDIVNKEYFNSELNLSITWFGRQQRKRRQITFGLFQESQKLIKIHKMMDNPFFPEYFVKFVIYHEMLHHVCPSYYDIRGKHHIHSKEFKEKEKQYKDYKLSKLWLKKHYDKLFH